MNAIFKYNNVYVVAPSSNPRSDVKVEEMPELIYDYKLKTYTFLYGGRIKLSHSDYSYCKLSIDGFEIIHLSTNNTSLYTDSRLPIDQVVSYLNQIENLGIDTFLDNYKTQLKNLKVDFENTASKLEQVLEIDSDDLTRSKLNDLRKIIVELTRLLFILMVNLNAGLDNHCYIEAFDAISNLYF